MLFIDGGSKRSAKDNLHNFKQWRTHWDGCARRRATKRATRHAQSAEIDGFVLPALRARFLTYVHCVGVVVVGAGHRTLCIRLECVAHVAKTLGNKHENGRHLWNWFFAASTTSGEVGYGDHGLKGSKVLFGETVVMFDLGYNESVWHAQHFWCHRLNCRDTRRSLQTSRIIGPDNPTW